MGKSEENRTGQTVETVTAETAKAVTAETAEAGAVKTGAAKTAETETVETGAGETGKAVRPGEEPVTIRLFKDNSRYKDDVFVAVNGRRWQIRRGETVTVPRYVADVLEQSMLQDQAAARLIERSAEEFREETRSLGL